MNLIGLTGGVGMGKSTSAAWLRERGIPLVDTDEVARSVVEPGQPALAEIHAAFGPEVLDDAGRLRRDRLAAIVFASADRRRELEAITHPRIRARWEEEVRGWRAAGAAAAVVVIPLLFETGAADAFDAVVCVACTARSQHERLLRRGWSEEEVRRRVAAQWPVDRKMTSSRYVLWTEGPLDILGLQWERVLARIG